MVDRFVVSLQIARMKLRDFSTFGQSFRHISQCTGSSYYMIILLSNLATGALLVAAKSIT